VTLEAVVAKPEFAGWTKYKGATENRSTHMVTLFLTLQILQRFLLLSLIIPLLQKSLRGNIATHLILSRHLG
jgi:hypothetical protein